MVARKGEDKFYFWDGITPVTSDRLIDELEESLAQRRAYRESQRNLSLANYFRKVVLLELVVSDIILHIVLG